MNNFAVKTAIENIHLFLKISSRCYAFGQIETFLLGRHLHTLVFENRISRALPDQIFDVPVNHKLTRFHAVGAIA